VGLFSSVRRWSAAQARAALHLGLPRRLTIVVEGRRRSRLRQ
jgi:hypothetical protein